MNKNIFNSIEVKLPGKNVFDLSHDVKLTCNMGEIIPILAMDVMPTDRISINAEALIRFQPLIAPVMHRFDVTMHFFFCPNRILWDNWESFISPSTGTPLVAHPYIQVGENTWTRLMDYFGLPPVPPGGTLTNINAFPFAAYQKIYQDYYRDQNLVGEYVVSLVDGNNLGIQSNFTSLELRAWEHDYFTSALPFAQKGAPVEIPVFGDVVLKDPLPGAAGRFVDPNTGIVADIGDVLQSGVVPNGTVTINGNDQVYDPNGTLEINGATSTINDLRRAYVLQAWLEKNARAGTRYTENLLVHFGQRSPDARLQRPEYIGGIKSPIIISEVLNTTGTQDAPQGQMAGHGVSAMSGRGGGYYVQEHGWIIGLMSVLPKPAYQQGIEKQYLKLDNLEYPWPSFANLGEQEVQVRELYAYTATGEDTFGYVPRYSEYKYKPSRVAGEMRTSLNFWNLSRIFAGQPALNQAFIECNPSADSMKRIFAVEDANVHSLICHVYLRIKAVRPLPYYGTPMIP